jgi:hypothetical protein
LIFLDYKMVTTKSNMTTTLMDCLLKARSNIADTYELDPEILENIHQIVVKACQPVLNAKPVTAAKSEKAAPAAEKAKVVRPKSAYNMFVKDKFRQNKEQGNPDNSQDIMSTVSGQWTKLSDEEKQVYVRMAEEANANLATAPVSAKATKAAAKAEAGGEASKRRITGYNLFYRENKDKLKEEAGRDGLSTMKAVGNAWKALTDAERGTWNTRASAEADGESA